MISPWVSWLRRSSRQNENPGSTILAWYAANETGLDTSVLKHLSIMFLSVTYPQNNNIRLKIMLKK